MSEIKVGEWIRTKNGQIDTFEETDENYMFARCKKKTYWKLDIVNHSKDIIDLIQKDDYVNGCRVYEVEEKGITVYQKVKNSSIDYNWIPKDEVKKIWTKEQLKFIEYNIDN